MLPYLRPSGYSIITEEMSSAQICITITCLWNLYPENMLVHLQQINK